MIPVLLLVGSVGIGALVALAIGGSEPEPTLGERAAVGWKACLVQFDDALESAEGVEAARRVLDRYSRWLAGSIERHPDEATTLAPYREAVAALRLEAAVRQAHADYPGIAKETLARLKKQSPRGKYENRRLKKLERQLEEEAGDDR